MRGYLHRKRRPIVASLILLLALPLMAQTTLEPRPERLPQDVGRVGLQQMFLKLRTTARLLHTTAHPDDEDGGMLTLQSRGKGATVTLLSLTRGEGGQNKMGASLSDELGVLRTLELLESGRYYGVEQRFTRVADFGYSKNATEAFQKWGGKETALEDMVLAIRIFRPDVIVSRFSGTRRDGHGQHEAAGLLTPEAFRAAADPNRFPHQLKTGLSPWQAKKLYVGLRGGDDWTVQYNTGEQSDLLGMSWVQFAFQGLRHQLSQGAGDWNIGSGPRWTRYKLMEAAPGVPRVPEGQKESDYFDGLDTTVVGLAARLGEEERKVPWLRGALLAIAAKVDEAEAKFKAGSLHDPAEYLLAGARLCGETEERLFQSSVSDAKKFEIHMHLLTKRDQFQEAARIALGAELRATMAAADGSISANESAVLEASFRAQDGRAKLKAVRPMLPQAWRNQGKTATSFEIKAPPVAEPTRWHFRRADPLRDTLFEAEPMAQIVALERLPVQARADYTVGAETGHLWATAMAGAAADQRPVFVTPTVTVAMESAIRVLRAQAAEPFHVRVEVGKNVARSGPVTVRLQTHGDWKVSEPQRVELQEGERKWVDFTVTVPSRHPQGEYDVSAIADFEGKRYAEGVKVISRTDLASYQHVFPARLRVAVVDVKVPAGFKVGYVSGAGDEIPAVLQQVGFEVHTITPEELASGDLSPFRTIVLGIRAYDTRKDVRDRNARLLQYVEQGGRLIVQYNADWQEFNAGKFTPYPAQIGRERVSVEEAPVKVLLPEDPIFHSPNPISEKDFRGWVQERGLYFMTEWDPRYEALLESADPGESPLRGGLLRATYGKGTYIHTSYAFFRQVPAGVPGAIRLFVNLIAAGADAN